MQEKRPRFELIEICIRIKHIYIDTPCKATRLEWKIKTKKKKNLLYWKPTYVAALLLLLLLLLLPLLWPFIQLYRGRGQYFCFRSQLWLRHLHLEYHDDMQPLLTTGAVLAIGGGGGTFGIVASTHVWCCNTLLFSIMHLTASNVLSMVFGVLSSSLPPSPSIMCSISPFLSLCFASPFWSINALSQIIVAVFASTTTPLLFDSITSITAAGNVLCYAAVNHMRVDLRSLNVSAVFYRC